MPTWHVWDRRVYFEHLHRVLCRGLLLSDWFNYESGGRWQQRVYAVSSWHVQSRRWHHLDDVRVYTVSRGDIRSRYHADDGCLLGDMRCGVLLSCGFQHESWGYTGWCHDTMQRGALLS
jgi:hypothetical protein